MNAEDCSKFTNHSSEGDWEQPEIIEKIRHRFVPRRGERNQTSEANNDDADDDTYGDFEDLETGETNDAIQPNEVVKSKEEELALEERRLKKLALRAKFDKQYPFTSIFLLMP